MEIVKKPVFSLSHVGINSENVEKAKETAAFLANMFDLKQTHKAESTFIEKNIEIVNTKGFGKNGHIAFYTENLELAIDYLEEKGIKFNFESAKYKENGEIAIIYMEQEISGFAIHLTSKK